MFGGEGKQCLRIISVLIALMRKSLKRMKSLRNPSRTDFSMISPYSHLLYPTVLVVQTRGRR